MPDARTKIAYLNATSHAVIVSAWNWRSLPQDINAHNRENAMPEYVWIILVCTAMASMPIGLAIYVIRALRS